MHEGNVNEFFGGTIAHLTRHVDPMPIKCWITVCDDDPTSHKYGAICFIIWVMWLCLTQRSEVGAPLTKLLNN